ncbi:RdgB/HAM1 family non-canonical purine NTP pyrophosphatase [Rhodopirellula sp. MGV]|uniref:RdgB/HAM1 family non-canonical purine NTP pyrophosphatase n=1 Tax=Rhodopirellula sp. MGV TaxID=2023130 RepID=UPI000B95D478|nr:RdgB/HAM1 family non-canonical purine NTP pyrophosphatase [Rhodopirellula sp. MGV]OYP28282.1 non-canonical purine NTP pyrophosphatase, RdgB/HAM1 family [Rhodopirellula sp. MGV]PNY38840.1 non-canonical purine NTP pyrophosphatase, RdgB/HAM1 family [Rhodopirellula baltica]
MFDLVLGTNNKKKLIELKLMLPPEHYSLHSLAEIPVSIDVDETGTTFKENAALKAVEQAKHLGRWVLAEDSGLAVDALNGDPGVYSARYAGTHGDDEANNCKLLESLDGVPLERRTARYHCEICLSDPEGNVQITAGGTCGGRIRTEPSGAGGFGYDPLFEIMEYHKTFAELDLTVKRALSHRSRALRQFLPKLRRLVAQIESQAV